MNVEDYDKLVKYKEQLCLGDKWKIGEFLDCGEREFGLWAKSPFGFIAIYRADISGDCEITKDVHHPIEITREECIAPYKPKYRPFKDYSEFVKHYPASKRVGLYRISIISGRIFIRGLALVASNDSFNTFFAEATILTEEQVINREFDKGIPFGVEVKDGE